MEELLEEYKQTLNAVIEKYSDFEKMTINDFISKYSELKQFSIHVVSSSFYTLEEWGQGSLNRGVIGTYKTREDAEKDRTDNYWQHIKEHKFK